MTKSLLLEGDYKVTFILSTGKPFTIDLQPLLNYVELNIANPAVMEDTTREVLYKILIEVNRVSPDIGKAVHETLAILMRSTTIASH